MQCEFSVTPQKLTGPEDFPSTAYAVRVEIMEYMNVDQVGFRCQFLPQRKGTAGTQRRHVHAGRQARRRDARPVEQRRVAGQHLRQGVQSASVEPHQLCHTMV